MHALFIKGLCIYLVDESMLQVDAPRIEAGKVSHKRFVGRGLLKRIAFEHLDKGFRLLVETDVYKRQVLHR